MRRELRNQINAQARSLLDSGAVQDRHEALALADQMTRCGAKTKSTGLPCKCRPEPGKRRCKLHGGKTPPRSLALREAAREQAKTQPRINGRFARNADAPTLNSAKVAEKNAENA